MTDVDINPSEVPTDIIERALAHAGIPGSLKNPEDRYAVGVLSLSVALDSRLENALRLIRTSQQNSADKEGLQKTLNTLQHVIGEAVDLRVALRNRSYIG